jgi:hypothetical protein
MRSVFIVALVALLPIVASAQIMCVTPPCSTPQEATPPYVNARPSYFGGSQIYSMRPSTSPPVTPAISARREHALSIMRNPFPNGLPKVGSGIRPAVGLAGPAPAIPDHHFGQ